MLPGGAGGDYVSMGAGGDGFQAAASGGGFTKLADDAASAAASAPPSPPGGGGSRLPPPSIEVVSDTPVVTPYQVRVRRASTYVLVVIYLLVAVALGLAIWQLATSPKENHIVAWGVAAFFVAIAVPLSLHDISMHMTHYVRPDLQRYYVRVLWMVPIYSVESWLALRFKDQKIYLETAREAYEAYVIYSFFSLLLHFCGGDDYLRRLLVEKAALTGHARSRMLPPFCWLRGWRLTTGEFIYRTKLGVFQYVALRSTLAVLSLVLAEQDAYGEGNWRAWDRPYPWFVLALNASQVWAMYCLVLFYHECVDILAPLRPLPKFLVVKAVVFFSFWQGIVISGLSYAHVITGTLDYSQEDVAKGLQVQAQTERGCGKQRGRGRGSVSCAPPAPLTHPSERTSPRPPCRAGLPYLHRDGGGGDRAPLHVRLPRVLRGAAHAAPPAGVRHHQQRGARADRGRRRRRRVVGGSAGAIAGAGRWRAGGARRRRAGDAPARQRVVVGVVGLGCRRRRRRVAGGGAGAAHGLPRRAPPRRVARGCGHAAAGRGAGRQRPPDQGAGCHRSGRARRAADGAPRTETQGRRRR
jgi:hypothetical protein